VLNSLESSEGVSLGSGVLEDESLNGSSGGMNGGGAHGGVGSSRDRVSGDLLDSVLGTMGDSNVESLLVLLGGGSVHDGLTSSVDGDAGGGLRSVVEAGHVQRVSGELVEVELDEVSVVTLGELPDEILRNGHLYR
jgi:hypothetical protein